MCKNVGYRVILVENTPQSEVLALSKSRLEDVQSRVDSAAKNCLFSGFYALSCYLPNEN